MISFPNPEDNLREQDYIIKCQVLIKEVGYEDFQSGGKFGSITEKLAFLVPQEGTERDLFFSAWLPAFKQNQNKEIVDSHNEVACKTGHPVNGFFRASVHRANKNVREPHIFVMSRSVEEDLKNMDGKFIVVNILPDSQSEKADFAKDFQLNLNKND